MELREVPADQALLDLEPQLAEMAHRYALAHNALYIARGFNVVTAYEGALKLKEVSYIHAEGYAAGELKHGPIALLDPELPVVAVATRSATLARRSPTSRRSAPAPLPSSPSSPRATPTSPTTSPRTSSGSPPAADRLPARQRHPLPAVRLPRRHRRGCDVDRPRNLAKSVTVE